MTPQAQRERWDALIRTRASSSYLGFVFAVVVVVAALLAFLPRAPAPRFVSYALTRASADLLQREIAPMALGEEELRGWRLDEITIDRFRARFSLVSSGDEAVVLVSHVTDEPSPPDLPCKTPAVLPGEERAWRLWEQRGPSLLGVACAPDQGGEEAARVLMRRLIAADEGGRLEGLWSEVRSDAYLSKGAASIRPRHVLVRSLRAGWLVLFGLMAWCGGGALMAFGRARESAGRALSLRVGRLVAIALIAITLAGFLLRVALATWGPGDFWMNQHQAFSGDGLDLRYGSAPIALIDLVFLLGFRPDFSTLIGLNLLLSALAAPLTAWLVFALRRGSGAPDRGSSSGAGGCTTCGAAPAAGLMSAGMPWALFAALLVAVQPLLVRHGGEGHRQAVVLVLALIAMAAMADYFGSRRPLWLAVVALAGSLCVLSRPEGLLIVPILGLMVVVLTHYRELMRSPRDSPALWGAGATLLILIAWRLLGELFPLYAPEQGYLWLTPYFLRPGHTLWVNSDFVPWPVIGLALSGLVVAVARRRRVMLWVGLSLLGVTHAVGWLATAGPILTSARYWTLSLPFVCLAAAFAFEESGAALNAWWGRRPAYAACAALLVVVTATSVQGARSLARPTTVDEEWRFIMEVVPTLEPGTTVLYPWSFDWPDVGFKFAGLQFPSVVYGAPEQRWVGWRGEPVSCHDGPVIYYHSAICFNPELPHETREVCGRKEQLRLPPLVTREILAVPMGYESYRPGPSGALRVGFFELAPEGCHHEPADLP